MTLPKIILASLFAVAMLATSVQAQTVLVPGDRTFFLRGEGCGASEDPYLSTSQGADGLDGCGGLGGVPFNEAFHALFGPDPTPFTTRNGVPVIVDNSRDLKVTITAETWLGAPTVGAGQSIVDVAITGVQQGSLATRTLGSGSSTIVGTGGQTRHTFTFNIPDSISTVPFTSLTASVTVRGANYNQSNLALEGDSSFVLPILIEQQG